MSAPLVGIRVAYATVLGLSLGCGGQSGVARSVPVSAQPTHASSATPNTTTNANAPRLGPRALPQVRWRFQTGGRIVAAAIEVVGGDFVVGSLDGTLYRLDPGGSLVYRVDTGAPIRARALAITEHTVLIGNEQGAVLHIDSRGDVLWRARVPGPIAAAPIADNDHMAYVAADGIYAFDADGNVHWHHVEATTVYGTPEWNAQGQLVFDTVDGRTIAIDTLGRVHSDVRVTLPDAPAPSPRATRDADGIAYAVGPDQMLRATRDDGTELWSYSLGVNVSASVLLAASGTLLIGTDDGVLYALH